MNDEPCACTGSAWLPGHRIGDGVLSFGTTGRENTRRCSSSLIDCCDGMTAVMNSSVTSQDGSGSWWTSRIRDQHPEQNQRRRAARFPRLSPGRDDGFALLLVSLPHVIALGMLVALSLLGTALRAAEIDAPVTISEDKDVAIMANGIVSITVNKSSGVMVALRYRGMDLLSAGGGYFNLYGGIPGQKYTQDKGTPALFTITQDPQTNAGAIGEINIHFPYTHQAGTVPLDIDIRFTMHRGDSGVYGWTIADHDAQSPPFDMAVSTVCLKMNPEIFDFLSIDSRRQKLMPSPSDWVKGTQLNLWEARLINTGVHRGEVEHKYDYNMLFSETPAWGWSSTTKHVGLFFVNPSIEYINGSPVMCDYGGHLDVKATLPADPTLLFIWHSPHYGGKIAQINANEAWRKIVGPFRMHCATGPTPKAIYDEAMARAAIEQQAWPYQWAVAPGYAHEDQRGSASGRLIIRDPQAPVVTAANAWVGLASPAYDIELAKGEKLTIDWQTDGKHYAYWIHADADGRFTIPHARPGIYNLYAFTNGVLGDYCHEQVRIEAGKTTALGDLIWTPVRHGRQLWDIGIPNRSAEEFKHGDHFWQWGLYGLYPKEFPNDVDYLIGTSDYRTDWNYAQPPRPADAESAALSLIPAVPDGGDADGVHAELGAIAGEPQEPGLSTAAPPIPSKRNPGKWLPTTWRIRYVIAKSLHGTATLRLALCGFRGNPIDVALNGTAIGSTGQVPESGVMHRDGIRSDALIERDIVFDAALLRSGENVFTLTKQARTWTDGVLYDYLRLELDDAAK